MGVVMEIYNISKGDFLEIEWLDPNGGMPWSPEILPFPSPGDWCDSVALTTPSTPLAPSELIPGTWTVTLLWNGTPLTSLEFTITLVGGCTEIGLGSHFANVGSAGGAGTVAVTTGAGCQWSIISSPVSWIHTSPNAGTGNGTVAYSVDANPGAARTGTFVIYGQIFTINQASGLPCVTGLQPTSATYSATGGSGTIAVAAAAGCSWTAATTASWIHVTSGGTGSGNGTVGYSVDANSGAARNDNIQAGGQTFAISEAAAGPPAPAISQGGVADPWTYTQGIAPGAWVSIYGSNLANSTQNWSPQAGQLLPTTLGGVSVTIGGLPAPISYVSPTLVNVLVPRDVPVGQVPIVVTSQGTASAPYQAQSTEFLPALYSNVGPGISPPRFYVTAVDPVAGQYVGNVSADPRVSEAVQPGETIDLYALGMGPAVPFTTDTAFSGSYPLTSPVSVVLGGVAITPSFAALVGPGLYQVRIVVPASTPAGDQSILLDFGVAHSAQNVYLTIQANPAGMLRLPPA